MTPKQFARSVAGEKDAMLKEYFSSRSDSAVGQQIKALDLTAAQRRGLRKAMNDALTDMCYTLLLALDGEASLDGNQQEFRLLDDKGNLLTGGELEAAAYEVFQGSD